MTATANTNRCNITSLALCKLKLMQWGFGCNEEEIEEKILENYLEYVACPDIEYVPCHTSICDNPVKHFTCALSAAGLDYTLAPNLLDLTFFIEGLQGGVYPYTYKWEYDQTVFTPSGAVNKETFTVRTNPGVKWDLLSTRIKVTITDIEECTTEIACCLQNRIMECEEECELCLNTYDLRATILDLNCHATDGLRAEYIDTLLQAPPAEPDIPLYGVILNTSDSIDTKIQAGIGMGVNLMRGAHETVSDYFSGKGSSFYTKCKAAGMKYIVNLNWNKTPSPSNLLATDETVYKDQLNKILNDYVADTGTVIAACIENEFDNSSYYGDTVANYIRQLGWAIDVCHGRVKVADGCVHIEALLDLINGEGVGGDVDQILTGINNLRLSGKVLDYVNVHHHNKEIVVNQWRDAVDYLKLRTGIQNVISNEWHTETSDTALITNAVQQSYEAGLLISVAYGGVYPQQANKAVPLNNGLALTNYGIAYRDAIQSLVLNT